MNQCQILAAELVTWGVGPDVCLYIIKLNLTDTPSR